MGVKVQGIPAAPGIVIGPAFVARWPRLEVPHATVAPDEIDAEVARFQAARQLAMERTSGLREQVESRLGSVQAKIFDPQLMMLEDPDLVEGTLTYICDSFLTAERAFSLRVLEFRSRWLDATHARVMDRVADLLDVQLRVLETLIDIPGPEIAADDEPVILVAHELTPSRMVDLDRSRVLGVATDAGTRTSHAAILARSIGLPCVVGLGDLSHRVENGVEIILDGRRGKVVIAPSKAEKQWFQDRDARAKQTERQLEGTVGEEPTTRDGQRIGLYANLEFPSDARAAVAVNADGVGLFRTEFLVVGKTVVPAEEEQYEAFKGVVDTMAPRAVTIRTFDLGGDKFPMFLPPIAEENPFLGWRGIRIYEMMPELFRYQVRAVLRAAAHGPVRLLVPMVNSVDEVWGIRSVIDEARRELEREGIEHAECPLGVMLETPASIAIAGVLGRYVDFFSLGTNDLIQYMLAVDRGNAQLSQFFDLYHPALLRYIKDAVAAASASGVPLCVCGEAAADPLASLLLLGLGVRSLSCTPSAVLGQKKLIRSIDLGQVEQVVGGLLDAETGREIRERMVVALGDVVDLSAVDTDNNLSHSD